MTPEAFILVNGSATGLIWGATLFFIRARLTKSENPPRQIILSSQFVIFFALAVTFTLRGPYLLVEELVPFNNLAWLLSYLSLTTALYRGAQSTYLMDGNRPLPVWARLLYPATMGILIGLYVTRIAHTPAYVDHDLARSIYQLLFMSVLFGYAVVMGTVPALHFRRFARQESLIYLRLRTFLVSVAAAAGVACMALKLIYTVVGYFWPYLAALPQLWLMMWICFIGAAGILLLTCLPEGVYKRVIGAVFRARDVLALYELRELQSHLEQFVSPILPDTAGWRSKLQNPHFHLYRTIVYFWDCQHLLPQTDHPRARLLHKALQDMPSTSMSFTSHVARAQQINLNVRRQMREELSTTARYQVAMWLSRIIHPFTLVVPTLIAAAWLSGEPLSSAIGWTLLSIPIGILPLLTFIAFRVRSGKVSDWDVSLREQRRTVYVIALGSIGALLLVYVQFGAPRVLEACLIAAIVAYALGAVVNQYWTKISIHATAAAGATAVLAYFSLPAGLIMGLAALAGGWSRIYLGRHTAVQVLLGWMVAILSVYVIFSASL